MHFMVISNLSLFLILRLLSTFFVDPYSLTSPSMIITKSKIIAHYCGFTCLLLQSKICLLASFMPHCKNMTHNSTVIILHKYRPLLLLGQVLVCLNLPSFSSLIDTLVMMKNVLMDQQQSCS